MRTATFVSLTVWCALAAGQTPREPHTFFKKSIGLSDDQIAAIDGGKAIAKVLPTQTPAEILVFGAVYVKALPEEYLKLARDFDRQRKLPNGMLVRQFSDPPVMSDLEGFALEPDDIKKLKNCKPGDCDVQLPAEFMEEFKTTVDWSAPNVASQVNDRARKLALEGLVRYRKEGNRALGTYRDKQQQVHVADHFRELVSRFEAMPAYLPEISRYLLDYPNATLPDSRSTFYWERVNFGLKPTLRVNHSIGYRAAGPRGVAHVVAVKQLYASHYFQVALDLTICITESGRETEKGFYLVSLKASRQDGLTGFKGSLLRRAVVDKTRSAQEKALVGIKRALESR